MPGPAVKTQIFLGWLLNLFLTVSILAFLTVVEHERNQARLGRGGPTASGQYYRVGQRIKKPPSPSQRKRKRRADFSLSATTEKPAAKPDLR